jgi:hypothetical protein
MESRSETLSATDVVNKGQGDGFSVRADNLQIWLCDRIRSTYSVLVDAVSSLFTDRGSVSKVEMTTPRALIYKVLFPSTSTFETPPGPTTGPCVDQPRGNLLRTPIMLPTRVSASGVHSVETGEGDSPTVTHEPGLSTAYEHGDTLGGSKATWEQKQEPCRGGKVCNIQ